MGRPPVSEPFECHTWSVTDGCFVDRHGHPSEPSSGYERKEDLPDVRMSSTERTSSKIQALLAKCVTWRIKHILSEKEPTVSRPIILFTSESLRRCLTDLSIIDGESEYTIAFTSHGSGSGSGANLSSPTGWISNAAHILAVGKAIVPGWPTKEVLGIEGDDDDDVDWLAIAKQLGALERLPGDTVYGIYLHRRICRKTTAVFAEQVDRDFASDLGMAIDATDSLIGIERKDFDVRVRLKLGINASNSKDTAERHAALVCRDGEGIVRLLGNTVSDPELQRKIRDAVTVPRPDGTYRISASDSKIVTSVTGTPHARKTLWYCTAFLYIRMSPPSFKAECEVTGDSGDGGEEED